MILGGVGRGAGLQIVRNHLTTLLFHYTNHFQPIIAIQNHVKTEQNSIAMALMVFSQTFGGALFLSFAETDLTTSLKKGLTEFAPSVDIQAVLDAGATGFRSVIPAASVNGVVLAYNQAISSVFYMSIGVSVATFFLAWGMGWKSVKKAKTVTTEA